MRNRWTDDVLRHQPDWVSIKIGINDLHRMFTPSAPQIPPGRYELLYREILQRTRAETKARLVLLDPFCNEPVHPNASGHLVIAHFFAP